MPTISDLPAELWDQILSNLWSSPTALGSARIDLRDFSNFRLVNREFRERSKQAFVDRNITHLRIRLGANPFNILPGFEDVRDTYEVLRYFTGFRRKHLLSYVKTIEFLHYQAKYPGCPSLDAACLARLQWQLAEIVLRTSNLAEVIFTGVIPHTGTIPYGGSSIEIFTVALRRLCRPGARPLQRISFYDCDIGSGWLMGFFVRHGASITTVRMRNVWLANGNWGTVLARWRNHAPLLQDIKLEDLHVMGVTKVWNWFNYASSTGPTPILPFQARIVSSDGTSRTVNEHYHLAGEIMSMKGRTGVRLGLNKLLGEHGSPAFDPALTHAALLADGRII